LEEISMLSSSLTMLTLLSTSFSGTWLLPHCTPTLNNPITPFALIYDMLGLDNYIVLQFPRWLDNTVRCVKVLYLNIHEGFLTPRHVVPYWLKTSITTNLVSTIWPPWKTFPTLFFGALGATSMDLQGLKGGLWKSFSKVSSYCADLLVPNIF